MSRKKYGENCSIEKKHWQIYYMKMNPSDLFRKAMRHLMEEKKVTQVALAKRLKMDPSELCGFLNDRVNFSDKRKMKIAQILGTTFMDMMNLGHELDQSERSPPKKPTHDEIIRRFSDKEKARQLNDMLVTLEKTDPEKYNLANAYVTALFDAVRAEKSAAGPGKKPATRKVGLTPADGNEILKPDKKDKKG